MGMDGEADVLGRGAHLDGEHALGDELAQCSEHVLDRRHDRGVADDGAGLAMTGGVAPDHQKIKAVTAVYDRVASDPRVRFFGNEVEGDSNLALLDLAEATQLRAMGVRQPAGVSPVPPTMGVALGASLAYMLPISTPPNAIVYGSGCVPLLKMMRHGIGLDLFGVGDADAPGQ